MKKKPEFKLIKEFKAFITKGNVVDLAVGIIIGAAFTAIVTALVDSIFKPLINAIPLKGIEGLVTMLVAKDANGAVIAKGSDAVIDLTKSVYIDWGAFLMAIVNFLLTAVVLFALIKVINRIRTGFGGVKTKAEFIASLTDEEKSTLKGAVPTRNELKAIKLAREEKAALEQEQAAAAATEAEAKKESTEDILKDIRSLLEKRD